MKWQPTPVFLPGKFHGQRRLAGYSPWGHKESDMTECAHKHTHTHIAALKTPQKKMKIQKHYKSLDMAKRYVTNRLTLQIHPPSQWSDW